MKPELKRPEGEWPAKRTAMKKLLMDQIKWIRERDPKRECDRMQGAAYAYKRCIQWLKNNP